MLARYCYSRIDLDHYTFRTIDSRDKLRIIKLDIQIDHLAIELYFHYFMISGAQRKLNGRESEGRLRKKETQQI